MRLDVVWVTRLVASVLRYRLRRVSPPLWGHKPGTCAGLSVAGFNAKVLRKFATVLGSWVHTYAGVTVDLACRTSARSA